MNNGPVGIYIHIPFCTRKCPYCDFYSVPFADDLADRYTEAVLRAMETHPFGALRADTLYFGGGTPVLMGAGRLGRLVEAARRAFGLGDGAEITLEANPAASMAGELAALRGAGFGRISFGVQSLQGAELRALGRPHSAGEARQAIRDAAAAGFRDISADLMLAVPGQTRESLRDTVDALAGLPVNHVSAYLLKVETGTPFAQKKDLALPDEDAAAQLYLDCVERLEAHGLEQYEISNYAREGRVSRHNLGYWRCREYLGIGPAAHSFIGGRRFYFPRDLGGFVDSPRPFASVVDDGAGGGAEEQLLLRLRLTEGLRPGAHLPPAAARALLRKAGQLAHHGLTRVTDGTVSLTPRGFLLSNSVIGALLEATDPEYF